jgi:PAS domain S-box-containing protein
MNREIPGKRATGGRMFAFWSRCWRVLVVRGVSAILLGVFAFVGPLATNTTLVLVFGAVALADGILTIAAAIAGRRLAADWRVREARRQQAEATLRDGEERLRLALEAASEGIYDHNLQTGEAHVSSGYATMLGYDPAAFLETTDAWIERMHPDDREPVMAQYLRYLAGEIPEYRVEFRQRTFSGAWRWIQSIGRIVERDASGTPLRMLGTHTDITERRQAAAEREKLQAQFIQAQKMESVGRLAGGVAHDFNNMLSLILGYAELAMVDLGPADPRYADLLEIRRAAERSADLTRQLLAFARKQTIAPRVLDLNETVEGTLKMLRRLIGEDVELIWLPRAGIWPVKIDPSQIDQILANLCVNARDAIAGVGKITIETGTASLDHAYCADHPWLVPGDYVLLAVSDNGCGMDKDVRSHLFEPFFTTKALGQGTGLGLATVYGIVKQNNGAISVYSELGQGTTIRIYLPRHSGVHETHETATVTGPAARGHETILLVEDEAAILTLATKMLTRQGYTVVAAGTPNEAIRLAREYQGSIHLLMTDVVMPEMDGLTLARSLLSIRPHMKCLFMSGYTANVIAHRGVLDAGVNAIQKPFSIQNLATEVRKALDDAGQQTPPAAP